jgi:N-acetylglucosamine-6-phosphate deacetylase
MEQEMMGGPGLCDLQVNGFAGVDFNDPKAPAERYEVAAARMRATGVTLFLPTLVTSTLEHFAACARPLARWTSPASAGIHMEGPYISPVEGARGAHPLEHVRPASLDDFKRRQDAAEGRIVLVTLAPEVQGAMALIAHLVASGTRVSIGHSDASPSQVRDAVAAGATLSTHLGNGSVRAMARHPNLIWEQLAADEIVSCFIADGHHLPASTFKAMVRAKTPARAALVTDAVAPAGCAPGRYRIGTIEVELHADGRVTMAGSDRLAGSALSLDVAVGNAVRLAGVSLDDALAMASTLPARSLGLAPRGRIRATWDAQACRLAVTEVTGADGYTVER